MRIQKLRNSRAFSWISLCLLTMLILPTMQLFPECGPTKGNKTCSPNAKNRCCDISGFCGIRTACEDRCQPGFGLCIFSCGPKVKKSCTDEYGVPCCNNKTRKWGSSYEDCRKVNYDKAWGVCTKVYPPGRCGREFGGTECPLYQCCDKDGYCGTTEKSCGVGCQLNYGVCTSNWTTSRQHTLKDHLRANPCDGSRAQQWLVNEPDKQLKSVETGKCLQKGDTEESGGYYSLNVESCSTATRNQQFVIEGKHISSKVGAFTCVKNLPTSYKTFPYLGGCNLVPAAAKSVDWTITYV